MRESAEKLRGAVKSDQPWTVRPGQEYKTKIIGRAQKTGTVAERQSGEPGNGHAMRAYREAIMAAKKDDVSQVFLNKGLKKASGHPIGKPNTRPDVTIVTRDGKVHQREVPSASDYDPDLMARMGEARSRLPEGMQGTIKLKHITKEHN